MSSILVVIGWYAAGFVIVRGLIDHGHSPTPWLLAAALVGAIVAVPAVLAAMWRHRGRAELDLIQRSPSPSSGMHVVAIAPIDRLDAAIGAIPAAIGRHTELVTVVGTVGHEAFGSAIDTGERESAAARMKSLVRPCSTTDNRIVTTDGPEQLRAVVDEVGRPDIVVARPRPGRVPIRRALARGLELSAARDIPVLIVPGKTSPARSTARELSLTA